MIRQILNLYSTDTIRLLKNLQDRTFLMERNHSPCLHLECYKLTESERIILFLTINLFFLNSNISSKRNQLDLFIRSH